MGNPLLLSKTKGQRPTDETRGMGAAINIIMGVDVEAAGPFWLLVCSV